MRKFGGEFPLLYLKDGRIAVTQYKQGEVEISFNPDDDKFYVTVGEDTVAVLKDWRNAVYRFKKECKK